MSIDVAPSIGVDPAGRTAHDPPEVERRSAARVWWRTYRHHLRLLRNRAIAWIAVVAGIGMLIVAGYEDLYPTAEDRARAAASLEGVPAFEALFGRTVELATVEGFVLWRWGGFAVLLVAVWGMFSAGALLRGAEESGHVEPLRAGAITPRGLLVSILAALFTTHLALAAAVGVLYASAGMDPATAWALGGALGLLAAMFASLTAVASQVFSERRRTSAVVGSALGVAVLVRVLAASEGLPDWLWWATPFGWASFLHEVDGARATVFGAFAVTVAVLAVAAVALARRDLHGGLVVADDTGADRARAVGGHVGLAARLVRAPVIAWSTGLAVAGMVFGLLADDFAGALADLPETVAVAEQIGWIRMDTAIGVASSLLLFLALGLGLFAASLAAGIRDEEASWRIEPILVRPVGRSAWLLGRVGVAAAALLVAAFATAAATFAGVAVAGDPLPLGDLPVTALNLVPISWMFLGLGVAVAGAAPRATAPVALGLVIAAYVLDLVGGILDIPESILRLGPYRHVFAVPATDPSVGPAVLMLATGAAGVAVGLVALRRRDLAEA